MRSSRSRPAVGERTAIIPLLNGMRHLDVLDKKFGVSHVLGGLCLTAVTLNEKREVVQPGARCSRLVSASATAKMSDRVRAIADVVRSCNFDGRGEREPSCRTCGKNGFFLASSAASTSLMRAPNRHDPGGRPAAKDFLLGILDECRAVATAGGLSAPRACAGTRDRDVDHGRLAAHRIDVPRH